MRLGHGSCLQSIWRRRLGAFETVGHCDTLTVAKNWEVFVTWGVIEAWKIFIVMRCLPVLRKVISSLVTTIAVNHFFIVLNVVCTLRRFEYCCHFRTACSTLSFIGFVVVNTVSVNCLCHDYLPFVCRLWN